MKHFSIVLVFALLTSVASADETLQWVRKPELTFDETANTWQVTFGLNATTDVEVAIVDPTRSTVVRHLAAGVLGLKAPSPLIVDSLVQKIEWDGKDDYGIPVRHASEMAVRVRAGMSVSLKQIVGGDPYAFYSKEMGQGDHAAWRITGLEVKSDGKVYVLGNASNIGPAAIRQYDAQGNYRRTVFPPPAGLPLEAVEAWGVNDRGDGTYTPQYNDVNSPALTKTFITRNRGKIATLLPSPAKGQLLLMDDFKVMRINTDGTIPRDPLLPGLLVNEPSIQTDSKTGGKIVGPMHVSLSPDGKHFYLSGIFAGAYQRTSRVGAAKTGDWRDGQVFGIDWATRKASVFFALPKDDVIADLDARGNSPIADFRYGTYAALQGAAADAEGRVFVCDRQNKRLVVLDSSSNVVREIPLEYPDAIAVSPKSKAIYVTTRTGHYHGRGELKLLKFDDWSKDTSPSVTVPLCEVRQYDQPTHLAVAESGGEVYVWVAYTALPVRVYKDTADGLELVKDFYEAGGQRALDLQHFIVDRMTESVYLNDGFESCFRIRDWDRPTFERCMVDENTPLRSLSFAIDHRGRFLYGHQDRKPVARYKLDGEYLTPAPPVGSENNAFTPTLTNDWRIGLGKGDRGIAVAPDGSLATMNALGTIPDYAGYLRFFSNPTRKQGARRTDDFLARASGYGNRETGEGVLFKSFDKVRSAGVRFDLHGNLYAGKFDGNPSSPPHGFENDPNFPASTGRIYKFAPTGSLESGNLFPTAPDAPTKVYDIHYGVIGPRFSRTPRFAVDAYGRIYYPTSLLPQVSVIDNEGNAIFSFGTYGNRDSLGGLPGDLVATKDIPMAWPNCVDATDDYIYVSDIVNVRLLRLKKNFKAIAFSR